MKFSKDSLIFLLGGMVVGLITGVLIIRSGTPRSIPSSQIQQQPAGIGGAQAQGGQLQGGQAQGALPEGHPPIDETSLARQIAEQEEILKKDPGNQQAIVSLGQLNTSLKKYQDAARWYEKARENDPKNPDILSDLGSSYLGMNEADRALEFYDQVLKIDPKHYQTLMNAGIAHMMKGDRLGAAEFWEKVLQYYPETQEAPMLRDAIQRLRGKSGTS